jgi:hypothetical protein
MATTFRLEHIWPVPLSVILAHHLDEEAHRRSNAAMTGADRVRKSIEERDGKTHQSFRVAGTSIPAAARKVLSADALEWIEESVWDPAAHRFTWRILPNVMKEKISAHGELFYEEVGGQTRRVVTGEIEIKIPIVGRTVEKVIVDQLKANYDQAAGAESAFYQEKAKAG